MKCDALHERTPSLTMSMTIDQLVHEVRLLPKTEMSGLLDLLQGDFSHASATATSALDVTFHNVDDLDEGTHGDVSASQLMLEFRKLFNRRHIPLSLVAPPVPEFY